MDSLQIGDRVFSKSRSGVVRSFNSAGFPIVEWDETKLILAENPEDLFLIENFEDAE